MNEVVLGIIASFLTLLLGGLRYYKSRQETKKKILEEAKNDLEKAHENKDPSSILDGWDKHNRV